VAQEFAVVSPCDLPLTFDAKGKGSPLLANGGGQLIGLAKTGEGQVNRENGDCLAKITGA
jgi:hypothetical protein